MGRSTSCLFWWKSWNSSDKLSQSRRGYRGRGRNRKHLTKRSLPHVFDRVGDTPLSSTTAPGGGLEAGGGWEGQSSDSGSSSLKTPSRVRAVGELTPGSGDVGGSPQPNLSSVWPQHLIVCPAVPAVWSPCQFGWCGAACGWSPVTWTQVQGGCRIPGLLRRWEGSMVTLCWGKWGQRDGIRLGEISQNVDQA